LPARLAVLNPFNPAEHPLEPVVGYRHTEIVSLDDLESLKAPVKLVHQHVEFLFVLDLHLGADHQTVLQVPRNIDVRFAA
jgi:hypothetical protein